MKPIQLITFILFSILAVGLQSCSDDKDEPKLLVDFSVNCNQEYSTGESVNFVPVKKGGTLTAIGWESEYTLDIKGVYDYFLLADGCPNWVTVSTTSSQIIIKLTDHFSDSSRKATVHFVVFKGDVSSSGFVNIIQEPITEEELKEREAVYMIQALAGKTIINNTPTNGNFISGADAPFYKLSDDVYMQVVDKTSDSSAKNGERVYFRFSRYRLIDWINGNIINNDKLTDNTSSFVLGSTNQSTTQWGIAIPLPMLLGLPYGSEVNLIVASAAGIEAEKPYYQPYFYNIRYYKAAY